MLVKSISGFGGGGIKLEWYKWAILEDLQKNFDSQKAVYGRFYESKVYLSWKLKVYRNVRE